MSDMNSTHNRVVWADVPVGELDRACAFYRGVLGVEVSQHAFNEVTFAVIHHDQGNGGCLVVAPDQISSTGGILVYFNVNGRIREATAQVEALGGKVLQPVHGIGPHGFRAVVLDSEGNRLALHSTIDA